MKIRSIISIVLISVFGAFTLLNSSCDKDKDDDDDNKVPTSVTDIDGNVYQVVTIGDQLWMSENLRVTKLTNGNPIPLFEVDSQWVQGDTMGYCFYDNNPSHGATYGALYNYYAVETRKLCPEGWRMPSDAEWTKMTDLYGGENNAGGPLKTTTGWDSPNTGATNESGFNAMPGGMRFNYPGNFYYMGSFANFWTGTVFSSSHAWYRRLRHNQATILRANIDKAYGYSVRCIKDNN